MANASILGSGAYLPDRIVPNEELEKILGLPRDFIEPRTGIKERRWSNDEETVDYMAIKASINAVKDAKVNAIDRLIISRDAILTRRAHSIGLPIIEGLKKEGINVENCFSIDLANYCPGFLHGLNIAQLMVRANQAENILVIGSTNYRDMIETNSGFNEQFKEGFDPDNECVSQYSLNYSKGGFQAPALNAFLWGCGAGAVVVGESDKDRMYGYNARGSSQLLYDTYGIGESECGQSFGSLDGKAIYRFAMKEVPQFIEDFVHENFLDLDDIDILVPHQPNPRMLKDLSKRISIPERKMIVSCDLLGNMIGASVPITYHQARKTGRIKSGDTVLMCSFGDSYLTVSGMLFEEK